MWICILESDIKFLLSKVLPKESSSKPPPSAGSDHTGHLSEAPSSKRDEFVEKVLDEEKSEQQVKSMEKTSAEQEPAEKSSIYSKVSFSKAATTTSSFDPVENFVNRKSVIQEDDNNKKEKTGSKYKMKKKSGHMLVKHICELFGGKAAQLKAKVVKSKKTQF